MPIYEFRCKNCGETFEEIYNYSDSLPTKCPKCGGELVRVYSGSVGLSFKGAGFYVNDYGKSSGSGSFGSSKDKSKKV
jgi:putative FmdB family regulatory protein